MSSAMQSALEAMKDLRSQIDDRLSVNEDYRALRALDKAILEVKVANQIANDGASHLRLNGLHEASAGFRDSAAPAPEPIRKPYERVATAAG